MLTLRTASFSNPASPILIVLLKIGILLTALVSVESAEEKKKPSVSILGAGLMGGNQAKVSRLQV